MDFFCIIIQRIFFLAKENEFSTCDFTFPLFLSLSLSLSRSFSLSLFLSRSFSLSLSLFIVKLQFHPFSKLLHNNQEFFSSYWLRKHAFGMKCWLETYLILSDSLLKIIKLKTSLEKCIKSLEILFLGRSFEIHFK